MVPSTSGNLGSGERFLKLVTVTPELVWPDKHICFGFHSTKNRRIVRDLDVNGKGFKSIFREIWVDER